MKFSADPKSPCCIKTTGAPSLVFGFLTLNNPRIYPSSVVTLWHS